MILGLDISTSCIGYSLFSEEGKLIELNCVKFNSDLTKFEKFEEFKKATAYLKKFPIKFIAIEEPLKKFMGKFSSAETIALLNFFNGMISSHIYSEFGMEPIYFNVNTARKLAFPPAEKEKKVKGKNEPVVELEEVIESFEEESKKSKSKDDKVSIKHIIWTKVMEMEPLINWRYGPRSRKLLDENFDMADSYVICLAMFITLQRQKDSLDSNSK
jgi:hypothetical protein